MQYRPTTKTGRPLLSHQFSFFRYHSKPPSPNAKIATWSPDMNVIVYHGNGASRALLREREFWHEEPFVTKDEAKKLRTAGRVKFHILITTYEVALKVGRSVCPVLECW